MRLTRAAAIASTCALAVSCKPAPAAPSSSDAEVYVPTPAGTVGPVVDAGVAPARCKLEEGQSATLRDVGDRRSLVVGDAVATPEGFVVGIVHAPATGAEALVARVAGHQIAEEWVVARSGELVADAPPPRAFVAAGALYAAFIARAGSGDGGGASRRVVLKKSGAAAPIATYPERADESLSFDVAPSTDASRAAVVWDEDAVTVGGITLAVVPLGGGKPLAPRIVSGDTADPDGPRVEPRRAGGWWVAWLAHRPEGGADAGARAASAAVEAPAEERVYSWIEIVAVGDDGAPNGAPRRITPALGHAASFDLASRSDGQLDVVVRDETQAHEGEGGRIVHLALHPDGALDEPVVVVPAGAGRGSVDLVTGVGAATSAWLTFSDAQDRALAVPLGASRDAVGSPSVEQVLEGGRLLALTAAGPPARFAAAFPAADGALFREATCTP